MRVQNNTNLQPTRFPKINKSNSTLSTPAFKGKSLSLFEMLTCKTLSKKNKMFYLKNRIKKPFKILAESIGDAYFDLIGSYAVIDVKKRTIRKSGIPGLKDKISKTFSK